MLHAAPMLKVRICVLERVADHVARALGKAGLLHLSSSVTEERGGRLEAGAPAEDVKRVRDLAARLARLTEQARVPPRPAGEEAGPEMSIETIAVFVEKIEKEAGPAADELATLEQALEDNDEIIRELAPYAELRMPLSRLRDSLFLEIRLGEVPGRQWESLGESLPPGAMAIPLAAGERPAPTGPVFFMAVGTRRRRFAMETVLKEHGFRERDLPVHEGQTPAGVRIEALRRHDELRAAVVRTRAALSEIGQRYADAIHRTAAELDIHLKLLSAESHFGATWATAVITGWVPAARADELRAIVMSASGGAGLAELSPPDAEDVAEGRVPSVVTRSWLLAPFARLVQGYGTATYTELEPTLLFTISFLALFGLIFGDLGHGLCVLAIGLIVRWKARSQTTRDVGFLAVACGLTAAVFGAFFQGAVFGYSLRHDLRFPWTLGIEPIRIVPGHTEGAAGDVVRYLLLSMGFGMLMVTIGVLLNTWNRLRARDYVGALLDRFGMAGLVFYWSTIVLLGSLFLGGGRPHFVVPALLIGLPLLAVVFGGPIEALAAGRRPLWRDGVFLGLFEGFIEGMETVMVYTSNTFSFLRVAAFALSHAVLSFTIRTLQDLVGGLPGGWLWSALVFVIGTAAVIGLEGLIVAIQILRLEYYEFFTKFFRGEGLRYRPFSLDGDSPA